MTIKLNVKIASDIGLLGREYRPLKLKSKKDELKCWLIKHKIDTSFSYYSIDVFWDRFIFRFPDEQIMVQFIMKWVDNEIQIEKEAETLVFDVIDKVYNKNV